MNLITGLVARKDFQMESSGWNEVELSTDLSLIVESRDGAKDEGWYQGFLFGAELEVDIGEKFGFNDCLISMTQK
ncbi:MAG TPA: hypothetical protein VJ508_14510 [Saprospiraceae bacterium]|nr:hypothetical protein [Saprospiraceae bacterium]